MLLTNHSFLTNCQSINRSTHSKVFTIIFTVDLLLNVMARGLFLHSYSYLKSTANVVFAFISVVSWTVIIILEQNPVIKVKRSDVFNESYVEVTSQETVPNYQQPDEMKMAFVRGSYQFLVLLNLLRLSRKLSRVEQLKPLRIFIQILLSLLPQLVPVALLIVYALLYYSELVIRIFPRLFRQLCVPIAEHDHLERLAKSEGSIDYPAYNDLFERMEESYTRINYNDSLYLYDYRPCGLQGNRENYLSQDCEPFDQCSLMSNHFLMLIGRLPPEMLGFESFTSTFLILAMGMFNQNFDIYFYRMIRHGGLAAFLVGFSLYAFGFLMLSLVLSMIYDTYQDQMCKLRMFSSTTHYYYTGEYEFSFDASQTKVCLRSSLMDPVERFLLDRARRDQKRLKNQFLMNKETDKQDNCSAFQQQMLQIIHAAERDSDCAQALQRFNSNEPMLDSTVSEYLRQCRKRVCDHLKHFEGRPALIDFRLGKALLQKNLLCDQWPPSQPYDPAEMHNMQLVHRGRHTQLLPPDKLNNTMSTAVTTVVSSAGQLSTSSKPSIKPTADPHSSTTGPNIQTYLQLERLETLTLPEVDESQSEESEKSSLVRLEKLLLTALKTVQITRIGRLMYTYIYFRNTFDDIAHRVVHHTLFRSAVNFVIIFKLLFFLLQLESHTYTESRFERDLADEWLDYFTPFLGNLFLFELSFRLIAGGWKTAKSNLFCFEAIPVFVDFLLYRLFDDRSYVYSNLRVLYVLYQRWPLLQQISAAITASRIELVTNVILFCLVYMFLVLYGIRFLFGFQVEKEDEDFIRMELDFKTMGRALRTVYLTVVGFAWQEIASQYLLFNKEIEPEIYFFHQDNKGATESLATKIRYIEQMPSAISIFVIIAIIYSLFFRNLFIPQIFHYLDLNHLLSINSGSLKAVNTVDRVAERRETFKKSLPVRFGFTYVWYKFKQRLLAPLLYGVQLQWRPFVWFEGKLRSSMFLINLASIFFMVSEKGDTGGLQEINLEKDLFEATIVGQVRRRNDDCWCAFERFDCHRCAVPRPKKRFAAVLLGQGQFRAFVESFCRHHRHCPLNSKLQRRRKRRIMMMIFNDF